jgi:hypothetical protein
LVTCATRTRLMGCTHSRGVSDWLHVRPELDLRVALIPGGCQIGYMGTILGVIMDHTGCHQLVSSTTRPTRVVTRGRQLGYMEALIPAAINWCLDCNIT